MRYKLKITAIILAMFLLTQLIGLAVISYYLPEEQALPYAMEPPEETEEMCTNITSCLIHTFFIAFLFALVILLVFVLIFIKSVWFMRIWFFIVVVLGIGISLGALTSFLDIETKLYGIPIIASVLAIALAYVKIFQRNVIVHNITELMVYPGIAAVFVSILNFWLIILLLIIFSAYDMWAVWHSGIMQKMAKFQMTKVGVLGGFFVPFASKKMKQKIKLLKLKYKNKKIPEKVIKKQKIKVNLAILGGGDVIFPIIAAGVFLKTFNNIWATLMIPIFAAFALFYLLMFSKKRKYYPALPFITIGIFIGIIIGWSALLIF